MNVTGYVEDAGRAQRVVADTGRRYGRVLDGTDVDDRRRVAVAVGHTGGSVQVGGPQRCGLVVPGVDRRRAQRRNVVGAPRVEEGVRVDVAGDAGAIRATLVGRRRGVVHVVVQEPRHGKESRAAPDERLRGRAGDQVVGDERIIGVEGDAGTGGRLVEDDRVVHQLAGRRPRHRSRRRCGRRRRCP